MSEEKSTEAAGREQVFELGWIDQIAVASPGDYAPIERISVAELAHRIGQTDYTTRNLLELHLIPGAERKTPGKRNSPWLVPANAPADYLAGLRNGKGH